MKFVFIFSLIFLCATLNLFSQQSTTLEGYLSDASCGRELTSLDGDDLSVSPEKHPLRCILFCKNSGFGILFTQNEGKYKFLPFDKKGNKIVKSMLKTIHKPDDIRIIITGIRFTNSFKLETLTLATN